MQLCGDQAEHMRGTRRCSEAPGWSKPPASGVVVSTPEAADLGDPTRDPNFIFFYKGLYFVSFFLSRVGF